MAATSCGHLRAALAERPNVALVDESPAVALSSTDGAVDGVVVEQNSRPLLVRAATVVLALDGFAGNQALMKEHCSAPRRALLRRRQHQHR